MPGSVADKSLFAIRELAERWGISPYTVRRLIDKGELHSVTIGARRLVPLAEVTRAEQFGLGVSRKGDRLRHVTDAEATNG